MAFQATEKSRARMRLEMGPARATKLMSRRGYRRRMGLTGTGRAPPKMNPEVMYRMSGSAIVMNGSM